MYSTSLKVDFISPLISDKEKKRQSGCEEHKHVFLLVFIHTMVVALKEWKQHFELALTSKARSNK